MMADYDFYYWPLPFRGQFILAILAFAGNRWSEQRSDSISQLMACSPNDQPILFLVPPVPLEPSTGSPLSPPPPTPAYL